MASGDRASAQAAHPAAPLVGQGHRQRVGQVEGRLLAEAEQILMHDRNRAWIDPMTGAANMAAASGKGVVAAFGALHLPGEKGVLRLLEQEGWTIERVE